MTLKSYQLFDRYISVFTLSIALAECSTSYFGFLTLTSSCEILLLASRISTLICISRVLWFFVTLVGLWSKPVPISTFGSHPFYIPKGKDTVDSDLIQWCIPAMTIHIWYSHCAYIMHVMLWATRSWAKKVWRHFSFLFKLSVEICLSRGVPPWERKGMTYSFNVTVPYSYYMDEYMIAYSVPDCAL